jgi:hypothetical protein
MFKNSFPRKCATCGRVFENLEHYFRETLSLSKLGNTIQSSDDDGKPFVVVSRNCRCGSTLLEVFDDRRDRTEEGKRKRAEFGELLGLLVASGLEEEVARAELKKTMRGEGSDILKKFNPTGSSS